MANLQVVSQPSKVKPILPPNRSELRRLLVQGQNRGWKRPLNEIQSDLTRPLPDDFISWFQKKSTWIQYLSWTDANMILDYCAPGWSCDVTENQVSDRVVVKVSLTLLCAEGSITRSSLGSENLGDENFGGPLPDAESQAFRRAAAKFGLCLYLYPTLRTLNCHILWFLMICLTLSAIFEKISSSLRIILEKLDAFKSKYQ